MVTDINMPNMNGFQLLAESRTTAQAPARLMVTAERAKGTSLPPPGRRCGLRQTLHRATLEEKVTLILKKMGL